MRGRNTQSLQREAGLAFARRWREARRLEEIAADFCPSPPVGAPSAARDPFPFRDHRTCAEWR